MGKGAIVSGGTDGLYTVTLLRDRTRLAAEIARLEAMIGDLNGKIAEAEQAAADAEPAKQSALADLDAAIAALSAGTGSADAVQAATAAANAADLAYQQATLRANTLIAQRASAQARLSRLQSADQSDPTVSAWCCDRTEDLSGEVATIEVPGERGKVLIRPGHNGGASYSCTRDGQLQTAIASTPAGSFFNLALLPWWQKQKPTYRLGTITALDTATDTCSVDLDSATSSAQGIGVNQSGSLTSVPVRYMTCDAAAFEVGDRVVMEFIGQSWSSPRVIGFESEPKTCAGVPAEIVFDIRSFKSTNTLGGTGLTPVDEFSIPDDWDGDCAVVSCSPERQGSAFGYWYADTNQAASNLVTWSGKSGTYATEAEAAALESTQGTTGTYTVAVDGLTWTGNLGVFLGGQDAPFVDGKGSGSGDRLFWRPVVRELDTPVVAFEERRGHSVSDGCCGPDLFTTSPKPAQTGHADVTTVAALLPSTLTLACEDGRTASYEFWRVADYGNTELVDIQGGGSAASHGWARVEYRRIDP